MGLRLTSLLLLIAVGTALGCSNANVAVGDIKTTIASVLSEWTVQDGASGGGYTYTTSLALDSSENTYLTGYTTVALDGQTQHGSYDFFITKYNSSGVRQWTVQDGATSGQTLGSGIVADSSGNVYVTGYTNKAIDGQTLHGTKDVFITKYNSSGVRQWTVQDGASSGVTLGNAVAVDASGSVYVTGNTSLGIEANTAHGTYDFYISKYSPTGTWQWTIEDGASAGTSIGSAIAIDSSENIYVAGYTTKALDGQTQYGGDDLFVTQYNSSGIRQWTVQDGTASGEVLTNGAALDSSGNIYITGYTNKAIDGQTQHGSDDFFATKYNSSGVRQWTVQDGASGGVTKGVSVAADSTGNIYLAGNTTVALDSQTQHGSIDLLLTKYNSSGIRQWTYQNGASSGSSYGSGVAADNLGNIYAGGYTTVGLDGQSQHGALDIFVMQKNAAAPW